MSVHLVAARSACRPALLALATLFFLLAGANAAAAAEYTVNSIGDQPDATPGASGCETAAGACTLRAAIEESNASAGVKDTIVFTGSFDGQVVDTIELATPLPTITDRVDIEGYPRPLDCETDYFSVPGPCVGIDGPPGGTAFRVAAERVLLIGFAISGAKTAVETVGAPGLQVWNNWFGLELDGSAGPLETGISIDQNSNGPLIGLSTNAGNIFAHSTNAGLEINGADHATVRGNGFGVLPDGNSLAANGDNIEIADAASGENRV
ncbi:MAG TPA: CSLREA domain-containing protein, partial [Solirubrobacterales bacterium]|nr:CSLREA domain-containing protein [Solirubrobacterales bacterium]